MIPEVPFTALRRFLWSWVAPDSTHQVAASKSSGSNHDSSSFHGHSVLFVEVFLREALALDAWTPPLFSLIMVWFESIEIGDASYWLDFRACCRRFRPCTGRRPPLLCFGDYSCLSAL